MTTIGDAIGDHVRAALAEMQTTAGITPMPPPPPAQQPPPADLPPAAADPAQVDALLAEMQAGTGVRVPTTR